MRPSPASAPSSSSKSLGGNLKSTYGWNRSNRDNDGGDEEEQALLDGVARDHGEGDLEMGRTSEERMPGDEIDMKTIRSKMKKVSRDASRTISFHASSKFKSSFPANLIRNQKYNIASFLPLVFYEQFKFFFNLYFLLVALSQFIPALKIGFIVTYVAPLAFVLAVTMGKEAFDDYLRHLRDTEANSARYLILDRNTGPSTIPPTRAVPSSRLQVGDLVVLEKNQRVPADMVLLRTSDKSGTAFVRTDQLDGETDWKLRVAVASFQSMTDKELLAVQGDVYADPPIKDIHTFVGTVSHSPFDETSDRAVPTSSSPQASLLTTSQPPKVDPLTAENILWANTVLAAGSAVGFVVYTGEETRAVMNTSKSETKVGLLDLEINRMAKILCAVTFVLSVLLVALNGFRGQWYIYVFRFLILFSSIIPISLRVNLDMGKTVYAHNIQTDPEIPGTIVRTSTLPEELGRIEYLLSDKTGTLTQNEMEMKKLHLGTMSYGYDSMNEVAHQLAISFGGTHARHGSGLVTGAVLASRGRRDMASKVNDAVLALAVCHNVTPVEGDGEITYQASSPDEVAIVKWTESIGLSLISRERTSMTVRIPDGSTKRFNILDIFPFTSESKRMGIIVRDDQGETTFYQKGADVVMAKIVQKNDWLEEECGNMAREGLRTLVVGKKKLSEAAYKDFDRRYHVARTQTEGRNEAMTRVVEDLERDLELLALTGVEDKLQEDVRPTLELLRNAGIKIWMLTGDKIETATCIAISTKLVSRGQYIHQVAKLRTAEEAQYQLDFIRSKLDCCLVIDGESLQLCLDLYKDEFIELATQLSCVAACRCSPTQKADVARLIRHHTKKRVCCIGDGGNDVSMIQAADVGVGIVGKEGKQASLAADFSINQFSYLTKLLVWHGRNSYKRSAKLAQFVIHRGLIISGEFTRSALSIMYVRLSLTLIVYTVMQAVFSAIFFFAPIALYQGWLQVGYATVYTMAPVFSLVLDRDVNEDVALLYPELYKELTKGRSLSYKTFFAWTLISVYQGGAIMIMSLLLFETDFLNIVAISFTALILNELIMVALEITTWHFYMAVSLIVTLLFYGISMAFLPEYFNLNFVLSVRFIWKVAMIVAVSSLPLYMVRITQRYFRPATYAKLIS
ncbi:aminophospholipid-transporting p-type atpase [Phaffia rhodozyma]|uniref:Phospholipid-transporting ATPase n=1 Tax=Phaffia rhodozyma TaxID=264483 RepID=A0A0F7SPY3_PHARH|nr:aminophospholipid-transporting p-type atpase [Phaffia rhodozyma]